MSSLDIDRVRGAFPDRRIDYYASMGSTMKAAEGLPLRSIVLADEQTAGLGRHGHAWHSEPGAGIYCSIVLPPTPLLTLALGLATAEAIAAVAGIACDLRWPNDVMLGNRKLAGILVQLVDGAAIAGIGINVGHRHFPPELEGEATSLALAWKSSQPLSGREEILIALFRAVDEFTAADAPTILRLFTHASSYAAGRRVVVNLPDGTIAGTTCGLDDAGFLRVRKDDGTVTLILAGGVRASGT
jgi:BirA family biotin operon repressor/biotin-[acetyl-CoA-carboxylase] ligase